MDNECERRRSWQRTLAERADEATRPRSVGDLKIAEFRRLTHAARLWLCPDLKTEGVHAQLREIMVSKAQNDLQGGGWREQYAAASLCGRRRDPLAVQAKEQTMTVDAPMCAFSVNGQAVNVVAPVGRTLAEVLREDLGLTGTKIACGEGQCGACTVLVDGLPTLSCIRLVHGLDDAHITTIEGLRDHPLTDAFVAADAVQCGFCTPGQIVSAAALVAAIPEPTREEIRDAMAGNLCRCGTYRKVEEAILAWRA